MYSHGTILFNDAELFEQLVNTLSTEGRPHVKSGENWSKNFREEDI